MRARYYDPLTGRFTSQDPGHSGTNWLEYANNDPTNRMDRDGRYDASVCSAWAAAGFGFAVSGVAFSYLAASGQPWMRSIAMAAVMASVFCYVAALGCGDLLTKALAGSLYAGVKYGGLEGTVSKWITESMEAMQKTTEEGASTNIQALTSLMSYVVSYGCATFAAVIAADGEESSIGVQF